jgi:signal transduction histidine kinase
LAMEEIRSYSQPRQWWGEGVAHFIAGVRTLVDDPDIAVRVSLADGRGHLRVVRSMGRPLNIGGRQTLARRHTLKDRIVRILERDPLGVAIFPIDRRGQALGVTEVTGRMATLARHQRELERMIGHLSAVLRRDMDDEERRRELDLSLAWTAHELRGPLHAVRAWLEHAASDATQVSLPVRRATDELTRIAGGLETLLSWACGRERLDERDVDLVALARDAVDSCIAETGQDRVVMEGTERLIVLADPFHLRSALENLVRNALRYSAPGTKVRVTVEPRDGEPTVEVENEGAGIPEVDRTAIFDPMTRGSDGVGSGLGLYVVGKVVEHHGGTIRCYEPEESKVSFELRLPPTSITAAAARLRSHA